MRVIDVDLTRRYAVKKLLALLISAVLGSFAAVGCYWTVDGYWDWPVWIDNWSPEVVDADAGCVWDGYLGEDVWYFEAEVDDYDGLGDIVSVEAHVYDDWHGGRWVDGFELDPTADRWVWYTEYPEHVTALDCHYRGYTVEFYVWDWWGDVGTLAVWPSTY